MGEGAPSWVQRRRRRRWRRIVTLVVYIALVVASHVFTPVHKESIPAGGESRTHEVTYINSAGSSEVLSLHGYRWGDWSTDSAGPPILLLHGSPGAAADFKRIAPLLAASGHCVAALDLPGFGKSDAPSNYSMLSFAHATLEWLEAEGLSRAHVVGWSNSGGVVLNLCALRPDVTASVTMLAAVGDQSVEGSGSYFIEHIKYKLGVGVLGWGPELVPHFGLLKTHAWRMSAMRFFADSDQRPLAGIMARAEAPVLVLHGRDDFLVPLRAARRHFDLLANSELHVMDASHFIPFMQPDEGARVLLDFVQRVNRGDLIRHRIIDDTGRAPEHGPARLARAAREWIIAQPWWVHVLIIGVLTLVLPKAGLLIGVGLAISGDVDWMLMLTGVACGRAIAFAWAMRRHASGGQTAFWTIVLEREPWTRGVHAAGSDLGARELRRGLASGGSILSKAWFLAGFLVGRSGRFLAWFFIAWLGAGVLAASAWDAGSWWGVLIGLAGVILLSAAAARVVSREGRMQLRLSFDKFWRHEYWSGWVFYWPAVAYIATLTWRYRAIRLPFLCNPGIENAGGLIGESKSRAMKAMEGPAEIVPTDAIAPGAAEERLAVMKQAADSRSEALYPRILKPDFGQRGFGVKLIRTDEEARNYLGEVSSMVVSQRFHPGPCECGVFWVRRTSSEGELLEDGEIYSITRKVFPELTGDGERTIEELIDAHPRFRRQREVFFERVGERRLEVPARGEAVRLAVSGNHCQGTLFLDGADLITPDLTRAITRVVLGFRGGYDFGRLDLRYESDELLRRGAGFVVIEINGLSSESTNMYDPSMSLWRSYRILCGQWRELFRIGAARRKAEPNRPYPMTILEMFRKIASHYEERSGSEIAD